MSDQDITNSVISTEKMIISSFDPRKLQATLPSEYAYPCSKSHFSTFVALRLHVLMVHREHFAKRHIGFLISTQAGLSNR